MTAEKDKRRRGGKPLCYRCGENYGDTDDHVPPKSFFPQPVPQGTNLITVPCCSKCNGGLSELDALFRGFLLCADGVSQSGKFVMNTKLFSEEARRHAPYRQLRQSLRQILVKTERGIERRGLMQFDEKEARRFLIRMTKAFLYKYYPEEWSPLGQFIVFPLSDAARPPKPDTIESTQALLHMMKRHVVLEGVFEFFHGVAVDSRSDSLWAYCFYDACWFIVLRSLRPQSEVFARGKRRAARNRR